MKLIKALSVAFGLAAFGTGACAQDTQLYSVTDLNCLTDARVMGISSESCTTEVPRHVFDGICSTPPAKKHIDDGYRLCILVPQYKA